MMEGPSIAWNLLRPQRRGEQDENAFEPTPLTSEEQSRLLAAARYESLELYALHLLALRSGLRRGEIIALKWGDIEFGGDDPDSPRFIEVRRNYVYGRFTTPKSRRHHRVDMWLELKHTLMELRDARLLDAFATAKSTIMEDFVFPSKTGGVLDPDHMIRDRFLRTLERAGIRSVRFHDLRHTFRAMLIAKWAQLNYVMEQIGHSSIQVTVDIYGKLIPGVGEMYVDRLDEKTSQPSTPPAQPARGGRAAGMRASCWIDW
jgi:integrase